MTKCKKTWHLRVRLPTNLHNPSAHMTSRADESAERIPLHLLTILYIAIHEYMHDSGRHMRPSDYGIRSSAATSAVISPLGVTCDPKGIGACLCVRFCEHGGTL